MSKWIQVGPAADLADGSKFCANADGVPVVVCKQAGELSAFQNSCPHAGLPLGEGDMSGKIIICPFHGYAYNVADGKNADFPEDVPLAMLPVRVEGDQIEVEVPSAS